jgi:hypothetical protein
VILAAADVKLEALEWEVTVAGGQVAMIAVVLLACVALTAGITYVLEELKHEHERQDEEPHR